MIPDALRERYALSNALGKGAQGSVFKGVFESTPVAVKIVRCLGDERRIGREIELLGNVSSANLVSVRDALRLEVSGVSYWAIAYDLVDGKDLQAMAIDEARPLGDDDAYFLARAMLNALEELWKNRVVHRDVKPANIMSTGERFVLVDLGLARFVDLSSVTGAGLVAGTPRYMSPEQLLGRRDLTINSDLFSLGVCLFELLSLRHPFRGEHVRVLREKPEDLRTWRPTIAPELLTGILGLLDKRPGTRLGTARRYFSMEGEA